MKKIIGLLALGFVLCLTACGSKTSTSKKIKIDGSTSMEQYINLLVEGLPQAHSDLSIEAQFTGSTSGIESLVKGSVDLASSSRSLSKEEKDKGLVENIVAIDGIGIIVDKDNQVNNLTKDQAIGIFTGKITNWKEVGGKDQAIVVIGRESGSGTRGAFEEILGVKNKSKYAQEIDSTGAVIAKVSQTPGSIGYVSLANIKDTVKAVSFEGVACNEANVANQSYKISRPFILVSKDSLDKQDEKIKRLFDYIKSEDGKKIIKQAGLVESK